VECIGICGGANISLYLANYIQGNIPSYPWTTEFTILYDASAVESAYNFVQPSTWVIIDKNGRIRYRLDDYTEYNAISLMIEQIDALLLE
jgi:predicted transcriptional regulator